jgi:hypothetical protein
MHLRSSDRQVFNPSFFGYRGIRGVEDAAVLKNVFQTGCNNIDKQVFLDVLKYCS